MNSYKETEAYLYSQLPMYQREGKSAFKKDLHNIKEICWHLGLPQWQFNSIHVAGTNGKGSVSSMLNSILMEAGMKVGLYTSPHLVDFTERIQINGKPIPQKEVVSFVNSNQRLMNLLKPSFFEITVAMAFEYFAKKNVDIAVVEVGLGGRLDSTNILNPEISVITNISFDHQAMLGDTLSEIASEKAGIIKAYTPVVIGETQPEVADIFQKKAEELGAPLFMADQLFKTKLENQSLSSQTFEVISTNQNEDDDEDEQQKPRKLMLDLAGKYQAKNLNTVLQTVEVLRENDWEVPERAVVNGLKKVTKNSGLKGRMQLLQEDPPIICDTAHNEAGLTEVFSQLEEIPHKNLHIVWGMVSDKDHNKLLSMLPKDATYYFVKPDIPRGLDAGELQAKAQLHGLKGNVYPTVNEGLVDLILKADPDDLGFVGGSTFVVAEVV